MNNRELLLRFFVRLGKDIVNINLYKIKEIYYERANQSPAYL